MPNFINDFLYMEFDLLFEVTGVKMDKSDFERVAHCTQTLVVLNAMTH